MNYNNLKLALFIALILGNFSCDDKTLYRATSDYFPLKTGMIWQYVNLKDNDTCEVKVIGDTSIYNHDCTQVDRDVIPEYWIKDKVEIRKLVEIRLNRAGSDFVLEQNFRIYFQLPLIEGNSWREDFFNTVDVLGDSVNFKHIINGKVEEIEEFSTSAGNFVEVYEVILVDTLWFGDSLSSRISYYWLAPETGIVKQRFEANDTLEQQLIQFTPNR